MLELEVGDYILDAYKNVFIVHSYIECKSEYIIIPILSKDLEQYKSLSGTTRRFSTKVENLKIRVTKYTMATTWSTSIERLIKSHLFAWRIVPKKDKYLIEALYL